MPIDPIDLDAMPDLAAQVRRYLKTDDIALFRIDSGTILAFEGAVAPDEVMRRPPQALIRCKAGGGYEMSRNL